MNWCEWIEENHGKLGGKAIFKGTRLSVEFVLERLAAGDSQDFLLEQFPTLKPEHLRAAFAFAADQLNLIRSVQFDRETA